MEAEAPADHTKVVLGKKQGAGAQGYAQRAASGADQWNYPCNCKGSLSACTGG
jgi:hypothetical protein